MTTPIPHIYFDLDRVPERLQLFAAADENEQLIAIATLAKRVSVLESGAVVAIASSAVAIAAVLEGYYLSSSEALSSLASQQASDMRALAIAEIQAGKMSLAAAAERSANAAESTALGPDLLGYTVLSVVLIVGIALTWANWRGHRRGVAAAWLDLYSRKRAGQGAPREIKRHGRRSRAIPRVAPARRNHRKLRQAV